MQTKHTSLAMLWLGAIACAAARPLGYVAPSTQSVVTETMTVFDTQEIYALNNSSVTILVTSVWLRDCKNVQEPCTQVRHQMLVEPGSRKRIATVHPVDRSWAYSYRFTWAWSPTTSH
jgi:hypothetical protein